jgi:hypothetical protein
MTSAGWSALPDKTAGPFGEILSAGGRHPQGFTRFLPLFFQLLFCFEYGGSTHFSRAGPEKGLLATRNGGA